MNLDRVTTGRDVPNRDRDRSIYLSVIGLYPVLPGTSAAEAWERAGEHYRAGKIWTHVRRLDRAVGGDPLYVGRLAVDDDAGDPLVIDWRAPVAEPTLTLEVEYGSEKKSWMEDMIKQFEAGQPKLSSGERVDVHSVAAGSGEAVQDILSGKATPHVFSPASSAYLELLNQQWLSQPGHTAAICGAGDALVLSRAPVEVLVDAVVGGRAVGRTHREAPEIDGVIEVPDHLTVGEFHTVRIVDAMGPDRVADSL